MSSWLSLSLPNPFKSSDDDDSPPDPNANPDYNPSTGVKEDITALSHALTRRLRGVASFLSPPPPSAVAVSGNDDEQPSPSQSHAISGIRSDLAEISDSFKSSLSMLSSGEAVSEISRFASGFLQFQPQEEREEVYADDEEEVEEEEEDTPGITEEVVDFVREVSARPELWTDFPLSLPSDFSLSDNQREHAEVIEDLVPTLATLRLKIHNQLSEGQFWMIYFILLLPRLHESDMELLSTPEIVQVRDSLLKKLQDKKNTQLETPERTEADTVVELNIKANEASMHENAQGETLNAGKEKGAIESEKHKEHIDKDAGNHTSLDSQKQPKSEEDISFSDLEDEDNYLSDKPAGSNENCGAQSSRHKSVHREKDSEGEDSSDWLTVDEIDLDNLAPV